MTRAERHRLILALTKAERKAHKQDHGPEIRASVKALIRAADAAELDADGTRVYVARWQTDLGKQAWARIMAWYGGGPMIRHCTHCGREFKGYRKTCSRECMRQRHRAGGALGHRTQAERGGYWTARSAGDARSVMIDGQLQVLDPVALVAAGYELRDVWGGVWAPL